MKKITLLICILFTSLAGMAQDTCATAQAITAGVYVVTAVNGTDVPNPVCADNGAITGVTPAGEWYSYTPTENHTVTVTSDLPASNGRDTRLHVYTGSCSALVCYTGDDDSGAGYTSSATFNVTAGTTYTIAWDNKWSALGFSFQLIEAPFVPVPTAPIEYNTQNIATVNSSYNICVVDMNGDQLDDIVGVSNSSLKIHYQQPDHTFTIATFPVTGGTNMPTWSLAAGDMNKDGYNDLLLGNGSGLSFWKSNATGTAYTNSTPGNYIFCQRTNFVDINSDGNLDAFSCHDVAPNVYYMNNGAGVMTYYQSSVTPGSYSLGATPTGGNYASLWTDLDNDGDVDMFISKCSGPPCEIHRNDGNGVFTDISAAAGINVTPIQSWSSAIADFDNDGDMDILIGSNGSVGNYFFRNNLNTNTVAYTNITAGSGWDTNNSINRDYIAYDFDNDGFVDVMGSGNKIMFNKGNNVFMPWSYTNIAVGAVGDLNNDGFLDILTGSTVRYAIPNGNHWLKVAFKGTESNSNGIGARVEIYGAFGKQIRDVRSGEGFEYMSSLNVHFGLGAATAVEKLVVKWPSGKTDIIMNPPVDSMVTVGEGLFPLSTGLEDITSFTVYPNPVKDVINISSGADLQSAQIYDLTGRLVAKKQIVNKTVNVSNLSQGTYLLIVQDADGKKATQKFIKS